MRLPFDPLGPSFGFACGVTMAFGAALSFAVARAGIVGGLVAEDLVLIRFTVAGLTFFPLLLRWGLPGLAGIGWRRGLILLAVGGPIFALLQLGGYTFAPLAHGAVIAPASVTLLSTIIAAIFLRERLSVAHLTGAALVIAGILALGWEGVLHRSGSRAWIGDLMFFGSAVPWAIFSVLLRHWRLDAVRAIAVVSVLSAATMWTGYAAFHDVRHLFAIPASLTVPQVIAQGILQGVIGLTAYSHAIRVLGVSRAVLFPAAVPAISVVIGIPIAGEWPTSIQIVGLIVVTIGLVAAIGRLRLPRRSAAISANILPLTKGVC
jgi:drug/metabolite transporter (DMT)-like permease